MVDGTLCMCNSTKIDFELKDVKKIACLRPYPVPRINKEMFRRAVEILVLL